MKGVWSLEEVRRVENQPFNSIYAIEESQLKPGFYFVIMKLGSQCFVDSDTYFELLA